MDVDSKQLFVVLVFLLCTHLGGSAVQASVDPAATTEVTQPGMSGSAPSVALRGSTTGGASVRVQSLEDVMKVTTSSLPKRLEAGIRRPTVEEAEKYGLLPNQGVVIGWLDPKGPLGRAGLNIGDLIVQVEGRPIEGLEGFVNLIDSIETRQAATFSVLDHRTRTLRNVSVIVGERRHVQGAQGNFFGRHVGAAVAGIKKAAQSVKQGFGYVADMGRVVYATVVQGLKRWAGETEEEPLASATTEEQTSPTPRAPSQKMATGLR